tara:strand:- start:312 stop:545 length:234 start_codon:yes stop_codon:yes gene_type:complete
MKNNKQPFIIGDELTLEKAKERGDIYLAEINNNSKYIIFSDTFYSQFYVVFNNKVIKTYESFSILIADMAKWLLKKK